MKTKRILILAVAALGLLAVACSGATSAPQPLANTRGAAGVGAPVAPITQPAMDQAASKGGQQSGGNGGVLGVLFQSDRVLILTASVDLKASDPWSIGDKVQALADRFSGEVVGVQQSGSGDQKSAAVTIRVPNDRFNDALAAIKGLDAELLRTQVTGQDKTEQFIDLNARLTAKQAEEQRYLALLARASTVDDILKVDQVLSNVRAQIEQLQGQVNAMKSQSSLATITVSVVSAAVVTPVPQTGWQPSRTFETALASLATFLTRFADLAIWAAVWLWVPALALVAALLIGRRRLPRTPV